MNKYIYIVGHRGMVGSSIRRSLYAEGFTNLVGKSSKGLELEFGGKDADEVSVLKQINQNTFENSSDLNLENAVVNELIGKEIIKVDRCYFRPTEVDLLIGDPIKSKTKLGWEPKYDLKSLVEDMVEEDVKLFQKDILLRKGEFIISQQVE